MRKTRGGLLIEFAVAAAVASVAVVLEIARDRAYVDAGQRVSQNYADAVAADTSRMEAMGFPGCQAGSTP